MPTCVHTAETCAAVAVVSTDALHPSPVEALPQQEAYDQLLVRPTLNQMQAVDRPLHLHNCQHLRSTELV